MNAKKESTPEVALSEKRLQAIERELSVVIGRTHHDFQDTGLLVRLEDEADALNTTILHDKERVASDRK